MLLEFIRRLRLPELAWSSLQALGFLALFFAVIAFFEWRGGADPRRYRSRSFLNDVVYSLFYRGGFYNAFIAAALVNAIESRLGGLRFDVLGGLPLPLAAVAYWIIADFIGYWIHRLQHRSRFLWAFHSVHHAQEHLSFLSSYRLHPVEQLVTNLIMIGPLLVLGVPTTRWVPFVVVQSMFEFAQHAELRWRYGWMYKVIVSPTFHAFHHSTDPAHYNRNYGKILSVWDFLFGTAVRGGERPARFGVDGMEVPERLWAQFAHPFRMLWRSLTS